LSGPLPDPYDLNIAKTANSRYRLEPSPFNRLEKRRLDLPSEAMAQIAHFTQNSQNLLAKEQVDEMVVFAHNPAPVCLPQRPIFLKAAGTIQAL
jgi:hypothetical protein